jgi:hypothetical protein
VLALERERAASGSLPRRAARRIARLVGYRR